MDLKPDASQNELVGHLFNQMMSLMESSERNHEQQKVMMFKREATNRYGSVKVVKMPSDGNCFFAACVHQLFNVKVGSEQHKDLVRDLRGEVCDYINANFDYFKHVIKLRLQTDTVSATMCTSDNFVEKLSMSGFWAGAESMLAISLIYRANIIVFDENGPYYFGSRYHKEHTRTVFLAYREYFQSGERRRIHYDSICEISEIVLLNCATDLLSKGFDETEIIVIGE